MKTGTVAAVVVLLACGACSSTPTMQGELTVVKQVASTVQTAVTNASPAQMSSSTPAPAAPSRCTASTGTHTITVWHIFAGDQAPDTFAALAADFHSTHPSLTLQVEKVGGYDDLIKRLQAEPKENWPDIVVSGPSGLKRLADSKMTIAPAECPSGNKLKDALLPVIAATYSIRGELQAVPYGVSTPVLLFDANEMSAAGLDPSKPPTTPEALLAASKQVVEKGVSPHGLVVYDWYAGFLVHQWAAQRGDLVATPNNGRNGEDITVDYNTPQNREALQWIIDIVQGGDAIWIGGNQSSFDDLAKIIDTKDGAVMSIHTSGSIGDVLRLLDGGSFPGVALGVGPMPGPGVGALVGGNGMWLVDHGSPERAGAAWEAIEWLTEPTQMARFDVATGYVPPSKAVAAEQVIVDAWSVHPQLRVGYDQLYNTPGSPATAGALYGPSTEIDSIFFDLTRSIIEHGVSPADALQKASQATNDLLTQYKALAAQG